MAVTHAKTDNIANWTQAQLDAQIALGNFPVGTVLNDIVLPSDWNASHVVSIGTSDLSATGAPSSSTFLRGDNTWASLTSPNSTLTIGSTANSTTVDLNLANANSWTALQTVLKAGIGATSTDGLALSNTTAAAAGAQQWSPRLHFIGQGWKTTATAASQATDWIVENQPVQGTANPTSNLVFSSQINAGGYVGQVSFSSAGSIIASAGTSTNPSYTFTGSTNTGFYCRSANLISISIAGSLLAEMSSSNGINLASSMPITWGHNGAATTNDVGLSRGGGVSQGQGYLRISNTSTGVVPVVIGGSGVTPGTVAVLTVNSQNTVDNAATVQISSIATTSKTLVLNAITSQSVAILDIQNNGGTSIASFDQNGYLNVNHIIGSGTAPTVAAGAGAGAGASATIAGHDLGGAVTLTLGTVVGPGLLFTVTFGTTFASAPWVVVSAANAAAGAIMALGTGYYVSSTSTTFTLTSTTSAAGLSGVPIFNYIVVQ